MGIELYWRTGEGTEMQRCARCGEEFAPVRFIQDLKKTLNDVVENYSLQRTTIKPGRLVQPQQALLIRLWVLMTGHPSTQGRSGGKIYVQHASE